jgi:hypothetical protein
LHVGSHKRKYDGSSSSKSPKKNFKKDVPRSKHKEKEVGVSSRQDGCNFCGKEGHYKKDCPDFLKWLMEKGIDEITFVHEMLYADFSIKSWWIDLGATAHVANSMQGLSMIQTTTKRARRL